MERPSREALFYALLFGLPAGVGIASLIDAAGPVSASYAVLAGAAGALAVGGFVLLVAVTGSETP